MSQKLSLKDIISSEKKKGGEIKRMDEVDEGVFSTRETSSWVTFDRELHLTVGQGDERRLLETGAKSRKDSISWGQYKLLLVEIDFLTRYWDPVAIPNPIVLYIGAASGEHINVLADLFEDVEFHLYDKRDFDSRLIESSKTTPSRINIFQRYFQEEDEKKYSSPPYTGRVFLISDIRELEHPIDSLDTDENKAKNEKAIEDDMNLQMSWVMNIKPVRANLKFRLPYSYDFILAKGKYREYLDGIVYRQPWSSQISTECRLVPHPDLVIRKWDFVTHEEQMHYHNKELREPTRTQFRNPFDPDSRTPLAPDIGLTNDYDSIATAVILGDYLQKIGVEPSKNNIIALARYTQIGIGSKKNLHNLRTRSKE
jgi:hypothetical protein